MKLQAQIFWWLVALFFLFSPWILILSADAQDAGVDADTYISAPEDMAHPATGEAGTWIPRWVERVHLTDLHRLQMCLRDVELADHVLFDLGEKADSLKLALEDIGAAKDNLLVEVAALEMSQTDERKKLERRTRAVWGLSGAAVAFGAAMAAGWALVLQ